ncbi:MAG: hypothetical protein Rsou_0866 [Candidatus Ruthia sp. Asou_11_S2]|nr:hypothetical protein [Candidatus Ruthia sp. Asou_11_S2]
MAFTSILDKKYYFLSNMLYYNEKNITTKIQFLIVLLGKL